MVHPVPTKAVLQPPKVAAMCTACLKYALPPPPIPSFMLAQNLSSKQIAPTDKHVAKVGQHQNASSVVKGLCTIIQTHILWSVI